MEKTSETKSPFFTQVAELLWTMAKLKEEFKKRTIVSFMEWVIFVSVIESCFSLLDSSYKTYLIKKFIREMEAAIKFE
jgi:hypothetical protein